MNHVKQRLRCTCSRPNNGSEIVLLENKEVMAFYGYPIQRSTLPGTSPTPKASFPFMKLPPEIRLTIYKLHFFQPANSDTRHRYCSAEDLCRFRQCNNDIPVRMLFMLSKTIYAEAMPLYYRTKTFRFFHCRVASFLGKIGPDQRQYVTKIAFKLQPHNARVELRALLDCPALTELTIVVDEPVAVWADPKGLIRRYTATPTPLELLLRIKAVENIKVSFLVEESNWYISSTEQKIREKLVDTRQVLEQPYPFKKRPVAGSEEFPIVVSDD